MSEINENQKSFNNDNNSSTNRVKNSNIYNESLMDSSSFNNSSIIKNSKLSPKKSETIPSQIYNCSTNFPCRDNRNQINKYLHTYVKYPIIKRKSNYSKIKIYDRPIYDYLFQSNSINTMPNLKNRLQRNSQRIQNLSTEKNQNQNLIYDYSRIKTNKKHKINFPREDINKKKKFDSFLNKYTNKKYDYFPKLLDIKRSLMINKRNDKYNDRNILFTKLKYLNFNNEFRNTSKKNFITPDKYLSINTNEDANFLEKKMTYRILGNIRFKMKSPVDRSKLLKFTKNFDSLLAINKFY
jgi:hypothetical protein